LAKTDLGGKYRWMEYVLLLLIAVSGMAFLLAILFILAVPINTYQHGTGTVQFRHEMQFVSGVEGIVSETHKSDFDSVSRGEPILTYSNTEKQDESALLDWRLGQARKELARLQSLAALQAIRSEVVEEKELRIREMAANKEILDRRIVRAPRDGRIYFPVPTSEMLGAYISKGQVLGHIFWDEAMVLKIEFPNDFIDRFQVGGRLVAYYRDPVSLVSRHLWAEIRSLAVDKSAGKIILYASETGGRQLASMRPGTRLKASVMLSSRSFIEDVFGVDLEERYAPAWARRILRRAQEFLPGPALPP
jgi:multidrug resistance efflux pump